MEMLSQIHTFRNYFSSGDVVSVEVDFDVETPEIKTNQLHLSTDEMKREYVKWLAHITKFIVSNASNEQIKRMVPQIASPP